MSLFKFYSKVVVLTAVHARSNHIRKNAFAYTFEPEKLGNSVSVLKVFLIIRIQNVCGKAILMCQIPIMIGVIYDGNICSKTPCTGFSAH